MLYALFVPLLSVLKPLQGMKLRSAAGRHYAVAHKNVAPLPASS